MKQCPRGVHYKCTAKQFDQLDTEMEVFVQLKYKISTTNQLGGPECTFVKSEIQSALTLWIKSTLCKMDNESEWKKHKDQSRMLV